ncbi:DUF6199 family natural product biosynthesis protein [Paenibacillus sp. FA6]|uniref:DUF6199 family natural product biosynthesis protein n=1 Tax=Paenibacillus sp. FA6 TaxID=3413029 RepID=UPI003F65EFE3
MFIFIGILIAGLGLLSIFKPTFAWYSNEGWKVKGDSEPSDDYITVVKLGGIVATIMGLLLIVAGILNLMV